MPLKIRMKKADSKYWDGVWEKLYNEKEYDKPLDRLLLKYFIKYLPKDGVILEGGCGLGRWVYYLKKVGYDIEGIDFAEKIVKRLNDRFPNLKIRRGDILSIKTPDNHYKAYISLGVFEHFEDGPGQAIAEAKRVLVDKGVLIVSIPLLNPLRKLKRFLGFYRKQSGEFYQYLYTEKEFSKILKKHGFEKIRTTYAGSYKGIKDELFKKISKKVHETLRAPESEDTAEKGFSLFNIIKFLVNLFPVRYLFGHTMILVCLNRK